MIVCSVHPEQRQRSETFMTSLVENLPGSVHVLHGKRAHERTLVEWLKQRSFYFRMRAGGLSAAEAATRSYLRAFDRLRPQAVLAQYGTLGVLVAEACRQRDLPLVTFFRGFDATCVETLALYREEYQRLFATAHTLVAVAPNIRESLLRMGAPDEKILLEPSGADCTLFHGALPAQAPPHFITVGRFVAKKAPHHTLEALEVARRERDDITLTMIGDGPLLNDARELAQRLGIAQAVQFLGGQPHARIAQEMRRARALVHPSVVASTGDSEGTPVVVMEAGASGLPVIGTWHGGIPQVVVDGETGLLVKEHDVPALAAAMLRLAEDSSYAGQLGAAAASRVSKNFSTKHSAAAIQRILEVASLSRRVAA